MKFRTEVKSRLVDVTIDGVTQQVNQRYEEKIPIAPRDWDDISTKVGFGLVGVLTLISIVWSTISIGSLLGNGVGYLAALLFDVSWAVCLLLEWKARFDPTKRAFPRNLGWVLLFVTMGFIAWHGLQVGNVPLAVVGACVSLFAKVLWMGIMKHVDRDLSDEQRQWVIKTIGDANARMAVAQVMRQVARVEDEAVAHKLAIETSRRGFEIEPTKTEQELPKSKIIDVSWFWSHDDLHVPVVYFILNGNMVKIGTTTRLRRRVRTLSLRMSNVIWVEPGGLDEESRLHRMFGHLRSENTEWFEFDEEIAEYINERPSYLFDDSDIEYVSQNNESEDSGRSDPPHVGHTVEPHVGHTPHTVEPHVGLVTKEEAVTKLVEMMNSGHNPSYGEAAKMFNRSESTVRDWVRTARTLASTEPGTGLYL